MGAAHCRMGGAEERHRPSWRPLRQVRSVGARPRPPPLSRGTGSPCSTPTPPAKTPLLPTVSPPARCLAADPAFVAACRPPTATLSAGSDGGTTRPRWKGDWALSPWRRCSPPPALAAPHIQLAQGASEGGAPHATATGRDSHRCGWPVGPHLGGAPIGGRGGRRGERAGGGRSGSMPSLLPLPAHTPLIPRRCGPSSPTRGGLGIRPVRAGRRFPPFTRPPRRRLSPLPSAALTPPPRPPPPRP